MRFFLHSIIFSCIIAIPFVFGLSNCARESRPMGGPTDTLAPKLVWERPLNNSVAIKPSKILVRFDERIQLDKVESNCLISPVFEDFPNIYTRRKKLIIDLKNQDFAENTTYTFNFSRAIKDVTEGNTIPQYVYAFSTGNEIDSLQITGNVLRADNNSVPKNAVVLLHTNLSDTAFTSVFPTYITRVAEDGSFVFRNIKHDTYRIYALVDNDNDYLFSLPSEQLAFHDSSITPYASLEFDTIYYTSIIDSLTTDSLVFSQDSLEYFDADKKSFEIVDSLNIVPRTVFYPEPITLRMFQNEKTNQSIRSRSRISRYAYSFGFNLPIEELVSIRCSGYSSEAIFTEVLPSRDSIIVWFVDSSLVRADSVKMDIVYTHAQEIIRDSVIVFPHRDVPPRLNIELLHRNGNSLFLDDTLFLRSNRPIQTISDAIALYSVRDTNALRTSTGEFIDTAFLAQVYEHQKPYSPSRFVPNFYYEEQSIITQRIGRKRFALYFARPIVLQDIKMKLVQIPQLENWCVCEHDVETNAVLCWITHPEASLLRNPVLEVSYPGTQNIITQTVSFSTVFSQTDRYRTVRAPRPLPVLRESQKTNLFIDNVLEIIWNNPIQDLIDTAIVLRNMLDTLEQNIITAITRHPESNRIVLLHHTAEPDAKYILEIERNAITDIFGGQNRDFTSLVETQKSVVNTEIYTAIPTQVYVQEDMRTLELFAERNADKRYVCIIPYAGCADIYGAESDSVFIAILQKKPETYGTVLVILDSISEYFVLELRSKSPDNSFVMQQKAVDINRFQHIPAGTYELSFFIDSNQNMKWDTGLFEEQRQPEQRYIYSSTIEVKANWDNTIEWNFFTLEIENDSE